jgi:archaellin
MGIGVLIIFISTILVSAVAAGVLIRTTGLLQERALQVEDATRNRLVTGVEVFTAYAHGNTTNETISEFEFFMRTRAGSTPVQIRTMGLSLISPSFSTAATLNTTLLGSSCTFDALASESDFCFETRLGNEDTVLEEGELLVVRYKVNSSHAFTNDEQFEISFLPRGGATETLELRTPSIILSDNIKLR